MKRIVGLLFLIGFIITASSCRDEQIFARQGVNLGLSADTIFLDTVFTQVGSSTRSLKVTNPTDQDLYIDRIYLAKGPTSYYRLNINGIASKDLSDVELLANDSITILIEVTTDVGMANEMLFTDSIILQTLGNQQDVDLVTLAKDAHFYYPTNTLVIPQAPGFADIRIPYSVIDCNATWGPDKPHVIYGYAVVDSGCVLTIQPGTEVHFHSGSGLWVTGGGTVQMDPSNTGTVDGNPIVIQGDRLEPAYDDIAGQWGGVLGGIFIQNGSTNNIIQNTIIKNGTIGLRVDSTDSPTPTIFLNNVIFKDHSRVSLYGGYANIEAQNTVIGNSGIYGLYALGGRYKFTHCTFGNYAIAGRSTPSIGLFNYFEGTGGVIYHRDVLAADFNNCIVYGNRRVEFGLGYSAGGNLNFKFNNCLLRIEEDPDDGAFTVSDPTRFENCIFNTDAEFVNTGISNFELDSVSPAIDAGNSTFGNQVPLDILKIDRTSNPDIGAYEHQ